MHSSTESKKLSKKREKSGNGSQNLGKRSTQKPAQEQCGSAGIASDDPKPAKSSRSRRRRPRKKCTATDSAETAEDAPRLTVSDHDQPTADNPPDTSKKEQGNYRQFPDYYDRTTVEEGLLSGRIVSGSLRINVKGSADAFINCPSKHCPNILISGLLERNRALEGDVVAVELHPEELWRVNEALLREGLKEELELSFQRMGLDLQDPGQALPDVRQVLKLPDGYKFVHQTGRVVSIVERVHNRKASGYLAPYSAKFALFRPLDSRVPRMLIPKDRCSKAFWSNPTQFSTMLFQAQITHWKAPPMAMGLLLHCFGSDSLQARTESMLSENDIELGPLSEQVLECVPSLPFTIADSEIAARKDLRNQCVFSVDPATARDLDDALSIDTLPNGQFKVGVHIADVSYFVKEDTALDVAAAARATSFYLVDRCVSMLPQQLCENLCSLNPGQDRLTLSVEWILSESGDVHSVWFGRSIIRSCCKLSYEEAQRLIDKSDEEDDDLLRVEQPWTTQCLQKKIKALQKMATCLRAARSHRGFMRLDLPKIIFNLDPSTRLPQAFRLFEPLQSHRMIEEFMLLANISVAKKLYDAFPDMALLRCHPLPDEFLLTKIIQTLGAYDVRIRAESSKSLGQSINELNDQLCLRLARDHSCDLLLCSSDGATARVKPLLEVSQDEQVSAIRQVLLNLLAKPMQYANYIKSQSVKPQAMRHFALNVDLYTHFTSPIRRYPDIVVHRMLLAALLHQTPHIDGQRLSEVCRQSNQQKIRARDLSKMSDQLYFAQLVCHNDALRSMLAVVQEVQNDSLVCILINQAMPVRVYVKMLQPAIMIEKGKKMMVVKWLLPDGQTLQQKMTRFSIISVSLKVQNVDDIQAELKTPQFA